MSGSFSLTEKLAVAAAFCAIVAMGVGTDEDPGVVAAPVQAVAAAPQLVDTQQPVTSTSRSIGGGWFSGTSDGAREAAEEDRIGSIGIEKAPEPAF